MRRPDVFIAPPAQAYGLRLRFNGRLCVSVLFYLQWLFVLFVSIFDSLLTIHLREQMMHSELNPLGRALLHLNSGDVVYFIAAKTIGTILAASIVLMLYWRRPSLGLAVVAGLATFQMSLLLFLILR